MAHARVKRGVEQRKPAFDIVAEIFAGIFHAFADLRVRGEVHDTAYAFEGARELRAVRDVSLDEFEALRQEAMSP